MIVGGRLTYGKAVIQGHQLERRQQWIGVACKSGLPHVADVRSRRVLVCDSAPMSTGPGQLQPVVAWQIPPLGALIKATTDGGLTLKGDQIGWEWAHKVGNTIQFRLYLKFLEKSSGPAEFFQGVHPLNAIDEFLGGAA